MTAASFPGRPLYFPAIILRLHAQPADLREHFADDTEFAEFIRTGLVSLPVASPGMRFALQLPDGACAIAVAFETDLCATEAEAEACGRDRLAQPYFRLLKPDYPDLRFSVLSATGPALQRVRP